MLSFGEVFIGRKSLRIPVSVFCSQTNFVSPSIPFASSKYQNFDLPGRHVVNVSINRETSSRRRHRNLSPSTFGICNKLKMSLMEPVQTIGYLGLVINSIQMTLSLTEEKVKGILQECKTIFSMKEITVLQLTPLVGLLSFTIQAVLPAQIQFRYLQLQQVSALKGGMSYKEKITLNDQTLAELQWWIENLKYFNGKYLIQAKPQIVIQTDASLGGWGANCMGMETGRKWSVEERKLHINILELLAVKNAILAFTKEKTIDAIHIQTDNTTALSYLLKMGGTTNKTLVDLSKDIWKYLILQQITITAEYVPGILNARADWQSRHSKDFSEWKLSPIVFQHICQKMGMPVIDLFASRLSNQIAKYFAWKPGPHILVTDAMQQERNQGILYAFPPFSLTQRVLCKIAKEKVSTVILITPAWQTQPWYPNLLAMSLSQPFLLPMSSGVLKDPKGEDHPFVINKSLALVA